MLKRFVACLLFGDPGSHSHGVVYPQPEDVVLAEEAALGRLQHERLRERVRGVVVRLWGGHETQVTVTYSSKGSTNYRYIGSAPSSVP